MAEQFKPLRELRGSYGSSGVGELVDFTRQANINLPASEAYFFEKQGSTVHVYGTQRGINQYEFPEGAGAVRVTSTGIELGIQLGGVEKVILHSKPYTGDLTPKARKRSPRTVSGSGESQVSSGEGRSSYRNSGSGESRVGES